MVTTTFGLFLLFMDVWGSRTMDFSVEATLVAAIALLPAVMKLKWVTF